MQISVPGQVRALASQLPREEGLVGVTCHVSRELASEQDKGAVREEVGGCALGEERGGGGPQRGGGGGEEQHAQGPAATVVRHHTGAVALRARERPGRDGAEER